MDRRLNFKRAERVGDLIRREISEMLIRGIKDPRIGLVTITRVRISDDLRVAKVYFSVMGGEEERERNLQGLESARGFIKREMGKRVRLRYVPEIVFRYDPSLEYADHIDRLIKEIRKEEDVCQEEG
ncbi:MAG: 30S ribosome-binding factor RbfA [Deltaproteobacteria bacterium]|nr:30S ribosome-binding factor RbfA [Deltaproteobacteria bacterium]MBW2122163.1 30S ribosome-binding factor RbfA [Deltaproteobacteria bacterium]